MDTCRIAGAVFVILLLASALNVKAGSVAGNLSKDWGGGIYECFVYFTEEGEEGRTYRGFTSPSGNFNINPIKQGNYAVVAANPFVYRRAYYPGIYVKGVGTTQVRLTTGCTYHVNAEGWFVDWHKEYAQTFVATGDSIIRIILNYAGGPSWGTTVKLTVREGGPDGPQVGPLMTFTAREGGGLPSFSFRAGEIPTTPGQVYAIKMTAPEEWSMYHSYGSHDDYPQGIAYVDGEEWPGSDLDITITSDDDGYITMMHTGANSYGAADEYGQTFKAMGYDISCVIFKAAGSSYVARVSIHEGGPDGPQIGPTKLIKTAGDVSNAVAWQPGEVPTIPGNTYYVKFVRDGGGQAGLYYHVFDPYPYGCMYENGSPTTGDLDLTIRGSKSLTTGRLTGTVYDEAGQGVDKAVVSIEGWWKRVLTDENGNYTIDPAPASPHNVVVEKDGYIGQYVEDVDIPQDGEATQNLGMVNAPNLIPDGSFESGTFTGWTYYGNISALEPRTGPWLGDIVPYDGTQMEGTTSKYQLPRASTINSQPGIVSTQAMILGLTISNQG